MFSLLFYDCIVPGNDHEPFLNLYFHFLKTKTEDMYNMCKSIGSGNLPFKRWFSHLSLSESLLLELILGSRGF